MRCLDFLVGIDVNLNAVFYKAGMMSTSNLDPPMQKLMGKSSFKMPWEINLANLGLYFSTRSHTQT